MKKQKQPLNPDNVWECAGCGLIVRYSRKPTECSCGDKNSWFYNSQIVSLNQRIREGIIGQVESIIRDYPFAIWRGNRFQKIETQKDRVVLLKQINKLLEVKDVKRTSHALKSKSEELK